MKSLLLRSAGVLLLGGVLVACGGSSFVADEETGGTSGSSGGGSGGQGATGGSGGKGGSGTGGSGTGGSGATGGGGAGGSGALGGTGATGGSGGSGTGGVGAGGTLGGSGGTGAVSGNGGVGGTCGACPRIACGPPFMAWVSATNGAAIADLEIDAPFEVNCTPAGTDPCQWMCQSVNYQLPSGDYSVTLSAPGFDPSTIEFSVAPQTGCGCCGCGCSFGYSGQVMLEGPGEMDGCCADRQSDPTNCGECGTVCSTGTCNAGRCPGETDCSALTTLEACEASSECHSVFVDPGTCGCEGIGCCARFSRCAEGDLANCTGGNVTCDAVTPHCESPAYVVSYSGFCYEGCVAPKDCAVAAL